MLKRGNYPQNALMFRNKVCYAPAHEKYRFMAAPKTKEEREIIKNHVSKLYLQGLSFRAMSAWLRDNTGFSVADKTCAVYVTQILDAWHNERLDDVDKWITAELKGLNEVEREAWVAWEQSKKDKTKSVTRKRGTQGKKKNDIETTNYEQYDEVVTGYGDPRFLEIIKDCKLQRLQYLTKGTFGKEDGNTNVFMQQVIEIGVVERLPPTQSIPTIDVEAQ